MGLDNNFVIFTDSDCVLCNKCVRFLVKIDRRHLFKFSFFGSDFAKKNEERHPELNEIASVLMISPQGNIYKNSDCIITLLSLLGGGWNFFLIFKLIPRPIRDSMYRFVAKNRHRVLGRNEHCTLNLEFSDRFYN